MPRCLIVKNVIVSSLLLFSINIHSTEITIAGDNWCPINCGESDTNQGFMIDVAKQAFKHSNIKVNYIEVPWTRAVGLARKGEIHAIVGAFKGDAPDFIFPTYSLLQISPSSLFGKNANWQYQGISSLNKVTLGTIKGYDYGSELNAYVNSLAATDSSQLVQLYGNNAVERSIQFLLRERINVFVESAPVFWYHANNLGVSNQVVELGSVSPAKPCYIAFSPQNKQSEKLALALDKGIQKLRSNKQIKLIANKYGLPESSYANK